MKKKSRFIRVDEITSGWMLCRITLNSLMPNYFPGLVPCGNSYKNNVTCGKVFVEQMIDLKRFLLGYEPAG